MKTTKRILVALIMLTFAAGGELTQAQRRNPTGAQIQNIVTRIETNTDTFKESLDEALDRGRLDGTRTEDEINRYVADFEQATDRLRDNVGDRRGTAEDVQEVFNRSIVIDEFMQRNRLTTRAQRDWTLVNDDLNRLGRAYRVAYRRNGNGNTFPNNNGNGFPNNNDDDRFGTTNSANARLTGTYRLDSTRSDDPRRQADAATRNLPTAQRQRVYNNLLTRLESPADLAIERRGRSVTIASTRAQQVTIDATGREESETRPNGRLTRVRADLVGDRLTITTNNDSDRANDFSVVFESLDNGRQLRVTRTVYAERIQQAVVVRSLYTRTSTSARFDIYRPDSYPNSNFPNANTDTIGNAPAGGYIVPNGTAIVAVLNNDISTTEARENERFTMNVRDQGQFDGATIEGYISNVSRSGRIRGRSGLTMNFERIRLRNGRTYDFAGAVESIRVANGEDVRVDNEGGVQDSDSQTGRTVQRAAIGTAVGALIGAIAGGGKGAAIGAVVGAGAGAGSVYAQGRDDLSLLSGTEITIRASAPR